MRFARGHTARGSWEEERITNVSKEATIATVRYILQHFGEVSRHCRSGRHTRRATPPCMANDGVS